MYAVHRSTQVGSSPQSHELGLELDEQETAPVGTRASQCVWILGREGAVGPGDGGSP